VTGDTEFEPTRIERSPRLSDVVAERLLDGILSRRLLPGDRLPSERDLSEQFDVSRSVVREAIRSLIEKGVVEARTGAGVHVTEVSATAVASAMSFYLRAKEDITYDRVHEIRSSIELQVAELAAERATDEGVRMLRLVHERHRHVLDDVEACSVADVEFHRSLAKLTGNSLFLVILDALGDVMLEIRRLTVGLPGDAEEGWLQHAAILDRVAARDSAGAREAMAAHLVGALRSWERLRELRPELEGALVRPAVAEPSVDRGRPGDMDVDD
jgi:GntR family transcriptional repressor for pyruvate dehydrogenase complex